MIDKQPEFGQAANMTWPAQHTYTRACDGLHPPGPCPGTEEPLKITEVQRLSIKEGDRLIARVNRDYLDEVEARTIRERLRVALQLPEHMPILVVTHDWEFSVTDHT